MSSSDSGFERRKAPRFDASMDGRLKCSRGSRWPVEITDISLGGCSVTVEHLGDARGRGYAIKFGGLEALGAELRWTGEDGAGLAFERPLHPAVLAHIVSANAPADQDDDADANAG